MFRFTILQRSFEKQHTIRYASNYSDCGLDDTHCGEDGHHWSADVEDEYNYENGTDSIDHGVDNVADNEDETDADGYDEDDGGDAESDEYDNDYANEEEPIEVESVDAHSDGYENEADHSVEDD